MTKTLNGVPEMIQRAMASLPYLCGLELHMQAGFQLQSDEEGCFKICSSVSVASQCVAHFGPDFWLFGGLVG